MTATDSLTPLASLLTKRHGRRQVLTGTTGIIVSLLAGACGGTRSPAAVGTVGEAVPAAGGASSVHVEAKYATPKSLADLVARSDVIVIGEVRNRGRVVNGARDPRDPTKPDRNVFAVDQLYEVAVTRYLKGTGAPLLQVGQAEGMLPANVPATTENIEKARASSKRLPLRPGARYLLFLKRFDIFGETTYAGQYEPWRFTVPEGRDAEPESPWEGAKGMFPPRPSSALIAEVERLVGAQPAAATPTPVPAPPKPGTPAPKP